MKERNFFQLRNLTTDDACLGLFNPENLLSFKTFRNILEDFLNPQ